ncbi:paraquat-inducible protein A [Lamprocystis purpurea]|uniref:paraquat-inducible protein A n=1 Tax=Lamprocystis purpurea TaxID=61598 RepID=UPI00039E07AC|nr:paraquat-inducible protein A [Lamprocystis purpurea]
MPTGPSGIDNWPESTGNTETLACPDCDLLQVVPELPPGAKAGCARCGRTLVTQMADPIERPLALSIAALLVLILANTAPLMGLSVVGQQADTTIVGGSWEMWRQGQELTAVVVAFCAVFAPAAYLLCTLAVLLAARRPPAPRWVGELLRWAEAMQPWSMVEVMMLGILVALIKIAELATVEPDVGMYAVGVLMLLIPAIQSSFDPEAIWQRVTWADDGSLPADGAVQAVGTPDPRSAP